jgi:hypothetical protein
LASWSNLASLPSMLPARSEIGRGRGPLTAQRGSDSFGGTDLRIEPRQARSRFARSRQVTRRRLGVASPSRPSVSIHLIGLGRTGLSFSSGRNSRDGLR